MVMVTSSHLGRYQLFMSELGLQGGKLFGHQIGQLANLDSGPGRSPTVMVGDKTKNKTNKKINSWTSFGPNIFLLASILNQFCRSQGGSDKQGQQEEDSQKEAETGNQQKSPAKSLPSLPIKKLTRKELIEQKGSKQGGLGFPLKESKERSKLQQNWKTDFIKQNIVEANKRNEPRIEEDESANEKSSENVVFTSRRQNSKKSETRNKKKTSSTSSMSSFRILPSIKDKKDLKSTETDESKNSQVSPLADFGDPSQLSRYLEFHMSGVTSRTMDLMIMEMRKLDRDRDRVLLPDTVKTLLRKYQIPVASCQEHLQDMFPDDTVFKGMTNYENLVRYLEEKRIANDEKNNNSENDRTDNFILYQSEHSKANFKRNRSWTVDDEEKLVSSLKTSLGQQQFSLPALADIIHSKDYSGHNQVSAPQLRSALRSVGVVLHMETMQEMMRAADVEGKGVNSIPAVLDILSKAVGR